MTTHSTRLLGLSLLATAALSVAANVSAATQQLANFEFNEGSGTKITDSINSLVGTPGDPSNSPTFVTDSPSGLAGDTAIHFESGQYFQVNDPSTRIQLDTNGPSFTMQAWVKFETPSSREVFFYNNGKGGALSFSINNDRTVFVTTLAIADLPSAAAIPDDGGWHHIAVVYDDGAQTLNFYVDGQVGDSQSYTSGVTLNRSTAQSFFSVGAEWNGALQYVGSLDRLEITSGVLTPDQLDFKAVPSGGTAGLTFASPTASPLGFSTTVSQLGGTLADTNSISLALNGSKVTPSSVTQSSTATTISYNVTGTPFPSGSTNSVNLSIKDTKGNSYTNAATFVVVTYASLPTSALVTPDTTKKGFKIRTYQLDGPSTEGTISTIAYNEDLLAGKLGPNTANTTDPVAGNADSNGFFNWTGVINFDANPDASDGYFIPPAYPQNTFLGIPGNATTGGVGENFAEEILSALNFTAPGMYTMAVVTDWTGFPDAADGFQLRAGPNPTNATSSVVLGYFDAAAPIGPTRGVADSPFQFYVPTAGSYPFRLMYYQTTGTAQLEWILQNADGSRSLVNDTTNSVSAYSQWTTLAAAPTVGATRSTNGLTLTFTGIIQSATVVTGPWKDLTGTSPMAVTTGGAPVTFYRAKQ